MDPLTLGLTLAPAVFKGLTGLFQRNQTVQRTDTTPAAFREALALRRQEASSTNMPGYADASNRLAQVQSAALHNATMGAASSSDVLAATGAADARRQQGEVGLRTSAAQYHDVATQRLSQALQQQAQYQTADDNRYNQATAALKANGLTNLFGGLSDAAAVGTYAQQANTPTAGAGFGGVDGLNFRNSVTPGTYDNPTYPGGYPTDPNNPRSYRPNPTIAG